MIICRCDVIRIFLAKHLESNGLDMVCKSSRARYEHETIRKMSSQASIIERQGSKKLLVLHHMCSNQRTLNLHLCMPTSFKMTASTVKGQNRKRKAGNIQPGQNQIDSPRRNNNYSADQCDNGQKRQYSVAWHLK